jgi:electron transport complex protein RnfD
MATIKTLIVSSPPHIFGIDTIDRRMRDVLIALAPAFVCGVYNFGLRAFYVIAVSVISAVMAEYLYQKISGKPVTIHDFSASITGLLLAFNLPPGVPFWLPVFGSCFAIIAVKQLFGGLGSNFMNPALAARAFMLAAFPVHMTTWAFPEKVADTFSHNLTEAVVDAMSGPTVDAVTQATYLALVKGNPAFIPKAADYVSLLTGRIGGCIGETSAIALILGGVYLLYRKIINWRIPAFYIGSFAIFSFIFGRRGFFTGNALFEVLSGGLLLGAIYMATDYATSPISPNGKILMGVGCGFLTVIIRLYSGYPEGVSYAIIIMNVFVPTIDKYVRPRVFGKKTAATAKSKSDTNTAATEKSKSDTNTAAKSKSDTNTAAKSKSNSNTSAKSKVVKI